MEQPAPMESRESERIQFRPSVVVLYGPTLSGKTTAAEKLASVSNFETYDADQIKRDLFADASEPKRTDATFYSAENTRRTNAAYAGFVRRAIENYAKNIPTVLSGTFSFDSFKQPLADALAKGELPADRVRVFLLSMPHEEEIADRARQRRAAKSESVADDAIKADIADYKKRAELMTPWPEHVASTVIESSGGKDITFAKILANLKT
ncbi:MAG: AAA family ATPase [Minisyncoccia bacterium]